MKPSRPCFWIGSLLEVLAKGLDFLDKLLQGLEDLVVDAVGNRHPITAFCGFDVQDLPHRPENDLFAISRTLFSCDDWLL